jgi:hypothetical protein
VLENTLKNLYDANTANPTVISPYKNKKPGILEKLSIKKVNPNGSQRPQYDMYWW